MTLISKWKNWSESYRFLWKGFLCVVCCHCLYRVFSFTSPPELKTPLSYQFQCGMSNWFVNGLRLRIKSYSYVDLHCYWYFAILIEGIRLIGELPSDICWRFSCNSSQEFMHSHFLEQYYRLDSELTFSQLHWSMISKECFEELIAVLNLKLSRLAHWSNSTNSFNSIRMWKS